jgi:mRNA-degrading endonuclease RelE of RelBE toxin-antitoxin system
MADSFAIRYTVKALADIEGFRVFDQRRVLGAIVAHLNHDPKRVSRSRIKLMAQPFWSQYRLRADEFRVYYDVDEGARMVNVLRVLEKGTKPTPEQSP